MMRTATLTLAAALAFLGAQAAHATDPCDHFVLVGSFANRAGALARAREIPGASVTFGNTAIPMFTPGRWHVHVGPLQTFAEADRVVARLRAIVPDAYAKHDCTGLEDE